jgi:hypothetical protein
MVGTKWYPTVWSSKLQVAGNHSLTDKKSNCGYFFWLIIFHMQDDGVR